MLFGDNKSEEYWKNCFQHWFCEDPELDFNTVLTNAEIAVGKREYDKALAIYETAQTRAQNAFTNNNDNPKKECALLELSRIYGEFAFKLKQKLQDEENRKRIIKKMEASCPRTEDDEKTLEKITDLPTREVVSELITFRNYVSKCDTAINHICNNFNEDYEECKKKNKR